MKSWRSVRPGPTLSTSWPRSRNAAPLSADQVAASVIAYEPVWAIGTGETATAEDAQEVCEAICNYVTETFGGAAGDAVRIQYGGSVKSSNVPRSWASRMSTARSVGGASLNPEERPRS